MPPPYCPSSLYSFFKNLVFFTLFFPPPTINFFLSSLSYQFCSPPTLLSFLPILSFLRLLHPTAFLCFCHLFTFFIFYPLPLFFSSLSFFVLNKFSFSVQKLSLFLLFFFPFLILCHELLNSTEGASMLQPKCMLDHRATSKTAPIS